MLDAEIFLNKVFREPILCEQNFSQEIIDLTGYLSSFSESTFKSGSVEIFFSLGHYIYICMKEGANLMTDWGRLV